MKRNKEIDWICFNGDVPDGHTPTREQWMTAVGSYAHFLKAAAEVIHGPTPLPEHLDHHLRHGPRKICALLLDLDDTFTC